MEAAARLMTMFHSEEEGDTKPLTRSMQTT